MNYDELRESLVDYFCRLEHGIEVAKIRAESVLEIVKVHADPAFILDCDIMNGPFRFISLLLCPASDSTVETLTKTPVSLRWRRLRRNPLVGLGNLPAGLRIQLEE